ncbi:MAG: hypothetical protein V3U58_04175 [Thermodesulfobacteriota bacterium]
MKQLPKTTPKLEDFPPKLRKLANTIIETIKIKTLKEYCELANVNYDSVRATIPRLKKKGLDFNVYMNNQYIKFLIDNKLDVSKSVVEGAMSGTSADKKLYFQLTGDLVERQQIDHKLQAKLVVFSPGKMPDDVREKRERETDEHGVQIIDTTFDD